MENNIFASQNTGFSTETLFPKKVTLVINHWVQFSQIAFIVFVNNLSPLSSQQFQALKMEKYKYYGKEQHCKTLWQCNFETIDWIICWWSCRRSSSAHFGPLLMYQISCFNSCLLDTSMNLEIIADKFCLWVHAIVLCDIHRGW